MSQPQSRTPITVEAANGGPLDSLRRQADDAVPAIKQFEDWLNEPGRLIVPAEIPGEQIGGVEYLALAIAMHGERWRLLVLSWSLRISTIEGQLGSPYPKRMTRVRRKPWLECGTVEKVFALPRLHEVYQAMEGRINRLNRASGMSRLKELTDAMAPPRRSVAKS